jgi:metal-sulfur cluster biosynthetic enzyme
MNRERKIETEEVANVTPPPRARVTPETPSETLGRKRDYLAGFLAGEKEEPAGGPGSDLQAEVVEALKSIYDPEIPVDIYELGLIYDVDVSEDGDAVVNLVWDPPWDPSKMSDEARLELGML